MRRVCFVSIDIEHDVGTGNNKTFWGVDAVDRVLDIFERSGIPATLFATGDVLERFPKKVRDWSKDYELASHSYSHIYFNKLSDWGKEEDIRRSIEIHEKVLGARPLGFRAPSHVIDDHTMRLLQKYGFKYDSSVVPHYPPVKKYRGYKGKAPLAPYKIGNILEIPVAGQMMGIPLAGAWSRKLPVWIYRILFIAHKPKFITLSMHSWDALDLRFSSKLVKILEILSGSGYVFKSGEQIATELSSGAGTVWA